MARHAQIDQNNKFANFCNIIRKKYIGDEFDFSHADKHQSMLQIDTMILKGIVKHSQKIRKKQVFNVFTISQKSSLR